MKRSLIILFLIILTVNFSLVSCKKNEKKKIKATPVSKNLIKDDSSNNNDKEKQDSTASTKKEKTEKSNDKKTQVIISKVGAPKDTDFMLYFPQNSKDIFYTDFEIGALQDKSDLTREKDAVIYELAEKFMNSLKIMNIDSSLILAKKYKFLNNNINRWFKDFEIKEYRFGKINIVSEPQSIDVKLSSENEVCSGTIYFINDGGWKIFDFHVNRDIFKKDNKSEKWHPG